MKQQLPINGATRLVGLMGWPISHSHSPAMHNAAFAALGLPWAYVPLPVQPGHAGDAVRGLAALGFAGANVTMPHKPAVMPHLDELTAAARTVGAVNTIIVREDGTLLGDTTDGYGFMADLAEHRVALDGPALVIGAGGAARSVTYALAEAGMTVAVCGLETDQAQHLCQVTMAALSLPAGRLTAHPYPAGLPELAPAAQLIVNAGSPFDLDGVFANDPEATPTAMLTRAKLGKRLVDASAISDLYTVSSGKGLAWLWAILGILVALAAIVLIVGFSGPGTFTDNLIDTWNSIALTFQGWFQ